MRGEVIFKVNPLWGKGVKKELKFWLLKYLVIFCAVIIFLNLIYTQDSILSSKSISVLALENYGVHIPAISDYFKMIIIPIFVILGIVLLFKTLGLLLYIVCSIFILFFHIVGVSACGK
ncbi:TPA: hypothetical protein ACR3Z0_006155 [Bacillus thuringiensis]|uniref:Uncharacterized protein n=1 Tax=Bacillus thuringiensis TaxID=1428 RepID=A0A9X6Q8J5_BACTU|nr:MULTISPECIES: hypothetical protein [Bacillus cereus group]AJA23548.1 hypothetical protein BT4G5_32645 [Bacillus thuringiensis serovar galleriae]EJQ96326.1 hypothetical protein II5_06106 [Bacillus cereus MSX-A1]ETE93779.1 hypothetical protein C623_0224895 [Bacillus thuringiensis serovar aizawai str. Hu4-2]KAB1371505.1 hypothetical protein FPG93_30775 [Bacillus thuringiensis]KXI94606.1 hypothetical protein ACS47_00910 [Bacillus cereus]